MNKLFAAVLFGIFSLRAVAHAQVLDLTGQADPGPAGPATSPAAARPGQPLPVPQQQMLDLSLLEALVAVDGKDLAGVFGFVPESAAAPAFSDYVMHNGSALKRFIKKAKRDIKETGGINLWDRAVFMYVLQINGLPALPPGMQKLSKSQEYDVSGFVLAKGLTLGQMAAARSAR